MPEEVAHVVADNRGAHQHSAQQVKVQPAARAGKTNREEKRIARKKEACQQAGFREDDSEQPGDAQRTRQQSARQFEQPLGVVQRPEEVQNGVHSANRRFQCVTEPRL